MDYEAKRKEMVQSQIAGRGIKDMRVLAAMGTIPRHFFVKESMRSMAYQDRPLLIGENQTISQPYMVAHMTEALQLKPTDRVLEIGTGSGYQTAILASLSEWVYSLERYPTLAEKAESILKELNIINVSILVADGSQGWEEHSPYDGIIVTAGSPDFPESLLDQLADGGRLVIPVGDRVSQTLWRVTKKGDQFDYEDLGGCRFVKLVGEEGWNNTG
jgi:protein-L-isoaspartate(D-aspartate) O-methyltransferase